LNVGDHDFGPFFGQSLSVCLADADTAAGDDGYFILQSHGDPPLDSKSETFMGPKSKIFSRQDAKVAKK
jgi:hypothetical protein